MIDPITLAYVKKHANKSMSKIETYSGELKENTVYTAELSGNVVFALPAPADTTCENQIRIMAHVEEGTAIDWGTTCYYNAAIPYCPDGYFEILFDFDPLIGKWVAGATRIGEVGST